MKRIKYMVVMGTAISLFLSGCGASVPELSQEDSALISEYAAGLLLKYDKNYENRLVDTTKETATEVIEENTVPVETTQEATTQEAMTEQSTEVVEQPTVIDNASAPVHTDLASFFQIEGIDMQYSGYELCESYPQNELTFSIRASMGKTLLVSKFTITNTTAEAISVDLFSHNIKGRVSIDGGETYRSLTTMLLNDLATFQESVGAGESKEVVLIVEIPKEQPETFQSMIMTIKTQESSMDIDLLQ